MKNNTKNVNAFANRKITVEFKKNHTIRKGRKEGTKEQQQQKRYNGRCKPSQSSHLMLMD